MNNKSAAVHLCKPRFRNETSGTRAIGIFYSISSPAINLSNRSQRTVHRISGTENIFDFPGAYPLRTNPNEMHRRTTFVIGAPKSIPPAPKYRRILLGVSRNACFPKVQTPMTEQPPKNHRITSNNGRGERYTPGFPVRRLCSQPGVRPCERVASDWPAAQRSHVTIPSERACAVAVVAASREVRGGQLPPLPQRNQ